MRHNDLMISLCCCRIVTARIRYHSISCQRFILIGFQRRGCANPKQTVSKILHSMSSSKATGLDEIPAKYLKDGSSVISKLLTHIINLSITTGSIPDDLKMARIVPLYKKNSKTNVGNYRPITVLSVISKVFEKVTVSFYAIE